MYGYVSDIKLTFGSFLKIAKEARILSLLRSTEKYYVLNLVLRFFVEVQFAEIRVNERYIAEFCE
jgi:hypothetical protein